MKFTAVFVLFAACSAVEVAENPIRRIVNLLQAQSKKVETQGEEQAKMFDKFVCYCETNSKKLAVSVDQLTDAVPQCESTLKSKTEMKGQVQEELKTHKQDREDANGAVETATEQRLKDKNAFDAFKTESSTNIAAMGKAVTALRSGMGESFLQSSVDTDIIAKIVSASNSMSSFDSETIETFLQGKAEAGGSGEIVGILAQMKEQMEADLKEAEESEAGAIQDFDGLVGAKQKEIAAATTAIEDKTGRVGTLAVDIVNAKNDLSDTQESLAGDTTFLAELKISCAEQTKLYEIVKKTRSEEIAAIGSCVKILNDDDALDLFKKTAPSLVQESFLQMGTKSNLKAHAAFLVQNAAQNAIKGSNSASQMEFLQLALKGKKADFSKIVTMMDDMVVLLKKEQVDDETKKEYCEAEFEKADDQEKELKRNIKSFETQIEETKAAIEGLKDEIAALTQGIIDLDKSVGEATETRKQESTDFMTVKGQNSGALQLLEVAKNQLNKFYNPKLYKKAERRELTEEERIYVNSGGLDPRDAEEAQTAATSIAGTGVTFLQLSMKLTEKGAPPPPPMAIEAYKKSDSSGPVALMDNFMRDIKMEMQEDDMNEEQAQKDYQELMKDSANKRALDSKTIVEKEEQKAAAEEALAKAKKSHKEESATLMALGEYVSNLHGDCDFLVQNFDLRRDARTNEIEAIGKAKAVLSGADYGFAQRSFLQK